MLSLRADYNAGPT